MSYELEFLEPALKEWRKLDPNTREQFRKKLAEHCESPHVPSARLHGSTNRYKIKLRSVGYRLVYEVIEKEIIVLVITVGRRERAEIYKTASRHSR
jgi:mRNA interferase RelE/StbE